MHLPAQGGVDAAEAHTEAQGAARVGRDCRFPYPLEILRNGFVEVGGGMKTASAKLQERRDHLHRARRRLRAAVRAILPGPATPGTDYVIVARPAVLTCPFDLMVRDLSTAFARIGRSAARGGAKAASPPGSPLGRSGCTAG